MDNIFQILWNVLLASFFSSEERLLVIGQNIGTSIENTSQPCVRCKGQPRAWYVEWWEHIYRVIGVVPRPAISRNTSGNLLGLPRSQYMTETYIPVLSLLEHFSWNVTIVIRSRLKGDPLDTNRLAAFISFRNVLVVYFIYEVWGKFDNRKHFD